MGGEAVKLDYAEYAALIKTRRWADVRSLFQRDVVFAAVYEGHAVPKERPRGQHHYTPKKTVKFEGAVRKWYKKFSNMGPVYFPVEINLRFYDETPKKLTYDRLIAEQGFIANQVGDVDNKVKAVTDAINGIAFHDDRQIKAITADRCYHVFAGFSLTIWRAGFSRNEAENLSKYMRNM